MKKKILIALIAVAVAAVLAGGVVFAVMQGKRGTDTTPDSVINGDLDNNDNDDNHLPQKNGREWYEADINYRIGKRSGQRIVWSNDGLIFVTYDHYKTFYEII